MYNLQSWDGEEGGKSVFDLPNFPPGHSIPNLIRFESRILLSKDLFIFLIRSLFSENFKKKKSDRLDPRLEGFSILCPFYLPLIATRQSY